MRYLALHARDRAGASGIASLRTNVIGDPDGRICARLIAVRQSTPGNQPQTAGNSSPEASTGNANALLDGLADAGTTLVSATALLVNELFQAFGRAEVPLLTVDGQLRPAEWGTLKPPITQWAAAAGVICLP